jgi:hypothetical protein
MGYCSREVELDVEYDARPQAQVAKRVMHHSDFLSWQPSWSIEG